MSIKDRFKMIMDREQLTAGAFAESIEVAQATISHILASRNNPSTEVILKLHKRYNDTLDIQVYNDYVVPNTVVEDGTVDANYFQHKPYLDDFNAENNTHIVSVAAIHVEPMGLYGGKQTTLDALSAK